MVSSSHTPNQEAGDLWYTWTGRTCSTCSHTWRIHVFGNCVLKDPTVGLSVRKVALNTGELLKGLWWTVLEAPPGKANLWAQLWLCTLCPWMIKFHSCFGRQPSSCSHKQGVSPPKQEESYPRNFFWASICIVQKALYLIVPQHMPATNSEQKGSDNPKTGDSSFFHSLEISFSLT